MNGRSSAQGLNDVMQGMMSAIHYFDIFSHPLTKDELQKLMHHVQASASEFESAMYYLLQNHFLYEHEGYLLPHTRFENVERRMKGEQLAIQLWPEAVKKSRLIGTFPFVEAVFVSGSMSKGFMDEDSDIDFLIITHPGRLWVARTLLTVYKKIFLLNSHRFFCVNYFLDTNNLLLRDRNLFVATELLFCKPVVNQPKFLEFLQMNKWAVEYYPSLPDTALLTQPELSPVKKNRQLTEKLLSGWAGHILDKWCMYATKKFWDVKFRHMNRAQYARDMKNTPGVSKHHPNGFRDRILNEHEHRMYEYDKRVQNPEKMMIRDEMQIPVP